VGEVVLLLTDVQGSTPLWEAHPSEMREAIALHNDCIRKAVSDWNGTFLKERGEGDSTFSVFTDPADAVAAAVALQRRLGEIDWPLPAPLRVRAAVYAGEADEYDGDFFGTAPNRAARLRGLASGGQVLVGEAVGAAIGERLPAEARLVDLGSRHLRGVAEPERIYEVLHPDLAVAAPEPAVAQLFGRANDLAALTQLIDRVQLVSVVGTGGAGKTSVASALAASLRSRLPDGVWTIDLAPVRDESLVASETLRVVAPQVLTAGVASIDRALRDTLADADGLLIFDNSEHLIDGVASLVAWLREACPRLRILTTTRQALNVAGENVYVLPPLAEADSLELLATRAIAAGAAPFSDRQRTRLADVCRMLDGLPLAIELAAARLRAMTIDQLVDRLGDQLSLLTKGARDGDERHRTMQATIDWSHEELAIPEQAVFRRLACFAGGFDFKAAERVVEADVGDALADLVDRSLVLFDAASGRYRLLEPVRQYAAARLAEAGEQADVEERHTVWAVSIAETLDRQLMGDQVAWGRVYDADRANIAGAIERCLASGDVARAAQFVGALGTVWFTRGDPDALAWVERLLPRLEGVDLAPRTAARAYVAAAQVAQLADDNQRSAVLARRGADIFGSLGRDVAQAWAIFLEGRALAMAQTQLAATGGPLPEPSRERFLAALELFEANGVTLGVAWCLNWLAPHPVDDLDGAERAYLQVIEICRAAGIDHPVANALMELGWIAIRRDDVDTGLRRLQEAVDLCRRQGDAWQLCGALAALVVGFAFHDEPAAGAAVAREALDLALQQGFDNHVRGLALSVAKLVLAVDREVAAELFAAGRRMSNHVEDVMQEVLAKDPVLESARQRGHQLSIKQLVPLLDATISRLATA
jgi:predicted ATPase/class 3 adenylate cyclase